jgi:DNA-binding response OmpR family regulator
VPPDPTASSNNSAGLQGPGVRVLVVEDSRPLADVIAEGLQDEGMAVDVAYDGLTAAVKLELDPYQVVILDRDLPALSGDTICRIIAERQPRTMVLMLTAAAEAVDRVAGLALGADDYLTKPFNFPELILRVRALARRQPTAPDRLLRAAGIEVDPVARTAIRDGRQLNLSNKELAVLEALVTAAPAPVSAERLLQQAWDENADPFTHTVKVTIARLRRKLGSPQIITTTPGIGYRIQIPGQPARPP